MNKAVIIQCGTPMEIYDTPQTAFVASFIGDLNLYHGVIKKEVLAIRWNFRRSVSRFQMSWLVIILGKPLSFCAPSIFA